MNLSSGSGGATILPSRRAGEFDLGTVGEQRRACRRPAGEALTRLPPMVACSRIWSSANHSAQRGMHGHGGGERSIVEEALDRRRGAEAHATGMRRGARSVPECG